MDDMNNTNNNVIDITEFSKKIDDNNNVIDLAKNIASSEMNPEKAAYIIEDFRKKQSKRLSNVYVFGPLMMFYAYRGRLSKIERSLLFLMGLSSVYTSYKDWKERSKLSEGNSYLTEVLTNFTNQNKT